MGESHDISAVKMYQQNYSKRFIPIPAGTGFQSSKHFTCLFADMKHYHERLQVAPDNSTLSTRSAMLKFQKLHMHNCTCSSFSTIQVPPFLQPMSFHSIFCHRPATYLTSHICMSLVTVFCKPDKSCLCVFFKNKTKENITALQFPTKTCLVFTALLKGVFLWISSRIRKAGPAATQHGVNAGPAVRHD